MLVNHEQKKAYISYSSNISSALFRLSGEPSLQDLTFELLELVTDPINLRVRCQYFKDQYASNGYQILNQKRVSNWKLLIEPIHDFRVKAHNEYVLLVKVRCRANKEVIVGVFEDVDHMDAFLLKYYPQKLVTEIRSSNNPLTKEYKEWLNVNS